MNNRLNDILELECFLFGGCRVVSGEVASGGYPREEPYQFNSRKVDNRERLGSIETDEISYLK